MSRGTATRVRLNGSPATNLSNEILDLGSHEALVLGDLADGLPDKIKLEKDEFADPARGTYGRTRQTFRYRPGQPAAALLDHDQKAMPDDVRQRLAEVGGFEGALATLLPGYADAGAGDAAPRPRPASSIAPRASASQVAAGSTSTSSSRTGRTSRGSWRRCRSAPGLPASAGSWSAAAVSCWSAASSTPASACPSGWCSKARRWSSHRWRRITLHAQPQAYEGALLDTLAACPPLTDDEGATLRRAGRSREASCQAGGRRGAREGCRRDRAGTGRSTWTPRGRSSRRA